MISLVPILLLSIIIVLLISLAMGLWCFSKRNKLQKTLIIIIAAWAAMFGGLLFDILSVYDGRNLPAVGVMNFHDIWLGLIGLFTLVSYPTIVLHHNILNLRRSLVWLSPILLSIGVYIVWHLVAGVPMNYRYLDYTELWANRFTVPVILRTLMLCFFVFYLALMLYNIWKLIPAYEKYSEDNYADTAHNIGWLRLVVAAIGSICSAYLVVIIWEVQITVIIYTLVTGVFFVLLSTNAFSCKLFTENDHLEVRWSYRNGWQVTDKQILPITQEEEYSRLELMLDEWIKSEKPFINPEFTASEIYAVLPELRYPVLTTILARRGWTFKSYVRKLRIEQACHIMKTEPQLLCKQIAFRVGFSSSEVLSRAFIAVTGETPVEFRKKTT